MISYCWKQQKQIKAIYALLVKAGYTVWLDIHDMRKGDSQSILNTIAKAVDDADIVLVAVSRAYSQSGNCRLEGEYAHNQQKEIMFMIFEEDYTKPTGWLGLLIGSNLWYAFH